MTERSPKLIETFPYASERFARQFFVKMANASAYKAKVTYWRLRCPTNRNAQPGFFRTFRIQLQLQKRITARNTTPAPSEILQSPGKAKCMAPALAQAPEIPNRIPKWESASLWTLAVFTKDYGLRDFRKYFESFGKFRRLAALLYKFNYNFGSVIPCFGKFGAQKMYFWPETPASNDSQPNKGRNFSYLSEYYRKFWKQ